MRTVDNKSDLDLCTWNALTKVLIVFHKSNSRIGSRTTDLLIRTVFRSHSLQIHNFKVDPCDCKVSVARLKAHK